MAIVSTRSNCHVNIVIGLVLCLSLACNAAVPKLPPSRDTFRGTNLGIHDKPEPDEKIFNVLNFGAKPDGRKDSTQVINEIRHA